MKKLLSVVLILVMCTGIMSPAMAQEDIKIIVNGNQIDFDVAPFIENDRTMVPLRAVSEAMGAEVSWNEETRVGSVKRGVDDIFFTLEKEVDSPNIYDNTCSVGYPCDVLPKIVNDRIFVPLRAIGESLDCDVSWDEATRTVTVNDKKQPIEFEYQKETVTLDTKDEYARIIVNYTYPVITDGKDFLTSENVEKLNQLIIDEKTKMLDIQEFADNFADDWQVIIETKDYGYPDITLNITTKLFTSEKYGTVSVRTWYDAVWTGAEINFVTVDKDSLEPKSLAECFPDKDFTQLCDEIYEGFLPYSEYVRYGRENFTEHPDWVPFVISDNDLYVQMSTLSIIGVGRYNRYLTVIKEY